MFKKGQTVVGLTDEPTSGIVKGTEYVVDSDPMGNLFIVLDPLTNVRHPGRTALFTTKE